MCPRHLIHLTLMSSVTYRRWSCCTVEASAHYHIRVPEAVKVAPTDQTGLTTLQPPSAKKEQIHNILYVYDLSNCGCSYTKKMGMQYIHTIVQCYGHSNVKIDTTLCHTLCCAVEACRDLKKSIFWEARIFG